MSVSGAYGSAANAPVLIRTTDGINYTVTPWSSLIASNGNTPTIIYAGGVFIAFQPSNPKTSDRSVLTSTDGLTWTTAPALISASSNPTNSGTNAIYYGNSTYVAVPANGTGAIAYASSLTATHVGIPAASPTYTTTGMAAPVNYVRIK